MTDDLDIASEREARFRDEALTAQARRSGLQGKTVADSLVDCKECDWPIPQARREAVPGVQTCVSCQERIEQARRGFNLR